MDSPGRRVGKCLLSALIAGVYGIVVAEVVANSLVEISITPIFSIVCILFFLNILPSFLLYNDLCYDSMYLKRFLGLPSSF